MNRMEFLAPDVEAGPAEDRRLAFVKRRCTFEVQILQEAV